MGYADNSVDLKITSGLPYNRRIRVTDGAMIWNSTDLFEVRSQVRVEKSVSSRLKSNLTPFLSSTIDGNDIVIDLVMKGEDTRALSSGYYDIVVSDVGPSDARAITILSGQVKLKPLVTAASDA